MPKNKLQVKNSFNLNLTPLLQNSLNLLSMSYLELSSEINKALENNIVLIEKQPKSSNNTHFGDEKAHEDYQLQIESKPSLFDTLLSQLPYANFSKKN